MEDYHIGKEIEKEVRKQYTSVDAFAKALHRERQTVYDIFKRAHIATDRLMEVSKLLNRDFFKEFSDIYKYGEITEVEDDTEVAECISQLIPENELQVIRAERLHELTDEFFLSERKKPMVIMHGNDNNIIADLRKVAEDILGKGMIKSLIIKQEDIFAFETSITRLSGMPQKAVEIEYRGSGINGGFDDIILLAEKLATESGKYVIVFCTCMNAIGKDADNHIDYCSCAEESFDTWHKRVHIFVADNENKDFARHKELYLSVQRKGCIDQVLSAFNHDENDRAGKILNKALYCLSTFLFENTDVDTDTSRYYVRSVTPTPEEIRLLDECKIVPQLSMWFDLSKSSGKLIVGGADFGNYVPTFKHNHDDMYSLMAKGDFT